MRLESWPSALNLGKYSIRCPSMKRLMLALAASLWLPTLCSALRAPAPAMRARAVAVQSPPAAQASDLAQNLASGEDAEKLSEPESWRWIDGSGKPMGTFSRVLEEIHRDSRDEVHVGCEAVGRDRGAWWRAERGRHTGETYFLDLDFAPGPWILNPGPRTWSLDPGPSE